MPPGIINIVHNPQSNILNNDGRYAEKTLIAIPQSRTLALFKGNYGTTCTLGGKTGDMESQRIIKVFEACQPSMITDYSIMQPVPP